MANPPGKTHDDLVGEWPPPLAYNGESLMQLVVHEYILRLIDTAEGVPGKSSLDMRKSLFKMTKSAVNEKESAVDHKKSYDVDRVQHTFKCMFHVWLEAVKGTVMEILNLNPPHLDSTDRDFRHIQRLSEYYMKDLPKTGSQADPKDKTNTTELDQKLFHVGIIGAGMAGLYTAMILKSLGISYEILEASDRIGGRVHTHRFSNDPGDYYDVGAMRFPSTPIMHRTFRLFRQMGIEKKPYVDYESYCKKAGPKREHILRREYDREQSQNHGDLIPYHLTGRNTPSYFNDRLVTVNPNPPVAPVVEPTMLSNPADPLPDTLDPYSFSTGHGGTVHNEIVALGVEKVFNIFDDWRNRFVKEPYPALDDLYEKDQKGVTVRQEIMERLDSLTVKYAEKKGDELAQLRDRKLTGSEKYHISNWCETMLSSTCVYDGALLGSVISSLHFDYPVTGTDDPPPLALQKADKSNPITWWCLNGGSDILAQEMTKNAGEGTITKKARVTAIRKHPLPSHRPMRVLIEGNPTEKRYSHVIATTTTPCLQVMDLSGVRLQHDQREAIRVLRYRQSVKLGIKFSEKWWIGLGINQGGQGKTDRPTRVVVYPSYALHEEASCKGVLLACYNSSTDAARLGALARGQDPTNQPLILDVVLHDLALMHNIAYKTLRDLVVAHHFHNWGHNEFTAGAVGDFAPGQFSSFFTSLQVPAAGGNLFFAGELTSVYHGWIVAALNSAHRAVFLMLLKEKQWDLLKTLIEKWGNLSELDNPSALFLVSLAERAEEFARRREELAVEKEKATEVVRVAEAAKNAEAAALQAAELIKKLTPEQLQRLQKMLVAGK